MSRRTEMIGSTLQKELMMMIMRDLHDPRLGGLPSITRVEVATDLSTADVFVTIMGSEGKQQLALNALKHSAGMMRQKLNKTLPMRTVPFLKFHIDDKLKKEIAVLELIERARIEEDQRKAERDAQNSPTEASSAEAESQFGLEPLTSVQSAEPEFGEPTVELSPPNQTRSNQEESNPAQ